MPSSFTRKAELFVPVLLFLASVGGDDPVCLEVRHDMDRVDEIGLGRIDAGDVSRSGATW